MNNDGKKWKKEIETNFPKGYCEPKWEDSLLQERMMRVGIEYKLYGESVGDIETIARLTLREDYKKSIANMV